MNPRWTRFAFLILCLLTICGFGPAEEASAPSFQMWQLPNQSHSQIMSYVIETPHHELIIVDGGMTADASYLSTFIKDHGGKVSAWIISHMHDDHFDALRELLEKGENFGTIYGSMPDEAWMRVHTHEVEVEKYMLFNKALRDSKSIWHEFKLGEELRVDGVRIEVLGVKNPELTMNPVNNSSLLFRLSMGNDAVLFPGDLGVEGGDKALKGPYADRLKSSDIQMAHHGQTGVSEAFYQHVGASACWWPTPKWLWDNDKGQGPGSGPWKTLEVRSWIEKMPVKKHYYMFEGLQKRQP